MTSLQRIIAVMSGELPDRVPVITFTNIESGNLEPGLNEYIRKNADAQYEFPIKEFLYNEFPCIGVNVVKEEEKDTNGWINRKWICDSNLILSDSFQWAAGGMYRKYRKHIIDDIKIIDNLLALPYLKPKDNKSFLNDVEAYIASQSKHNTDNEFCSIIVNDGLSFIASNSLPEDMAVWSVIERETVSRYIWEITLRMTEYLEYMLSNYPFECIFMIGGPEYGIPPLMSPESFNEFVYENDRKLIDVLHCCGKKVLLHCHGKIRNFIPLMIEMGADAIHPLEAMGPTGDCDIAEVKRKLGDNFCIVGDIQFNSFVESTEQEMEQEVKALIDICKPGGRFILSPACPLYYDQSASDIDKNVRAFIDAGLKYGRYDNC